MKKILSSLIIILCIGGLIYSGYHIYTWKKSLDENSKIKNSLQENITIKNKEYDINFSKIKSQNSDAVAFIKVNDTDIEYIVVKGKDNSFYLNHNFNKEYNSAGWIFADSRNNFDGNDKNIIIYGHNMRDGSMFGKLKNTLTTTWQSKKSNLIVTLVTESKTYKYKVFSTYVVEPEEYYISTNFINNDYYIEFLNTLKNRSNNNYNEELNENDKILTLSSCVGDGKKRVVLHAKLIN